MHPAIFFNVMAFLVFAAAWHQFELSPKCQSCSARVRHRSDCPNRRDGD